jgi:nucleotide-binding universal stress UspA family protein
LVANEIKPDIIVVGSKGKGKIARFLLGSVSRKIAELAKCSVFVVK